MIFVSLSEYPQGWLPEHALDRCYISTILVFGQQYNTLVFRTLAWVNP
jgi:hypothetical protein